MTEPFKIRATRSLTTVQVAAVYGHVRVTSDGTFVEYTVEQARQLGNAILHAAADAGAIPTWEHRGTTYDLTESWREYIAPGVPMPEHWSWTGEYTADGVPLMTPIGTGDEDMIGSTMPFDRLLDDARGGETGETGEKPRRRLP